MRMSRLVRWLAVVAVVGFVLTYFVSVSFVLVLLGGGIAYELWTNGERSLRDLALVCREL